MKRTSLVVLLVAGSLLAAGAGATQGSATPAPKASAAAAGPQNVIVVLRDQPAGATAGTAQSSARTALVTADQSPLRSQVGQLGGEVTHAYRTLNALAATVPGTAVADLRRDPNVAAVVPDLTWKLPTPTNPAANNAAPGAASASASTAPAATTPAGLCPTDPAKPMLEPEALQLTHTASDDPNAPTARRLGYDGSGVKVAFIADGLDINQPDFIRADGSHVITDYQDFSGDGVNADTSGGEAFGDASTIGAQGRQTYDLSTFVNAAHPLPPGCNIRVEGVAPGASMVSLKIFSNALRTAPTSTIIQAIDYAVNVDHVNVISESFGASPYPDTANDPISIFNHNAVDAGVTVVADTGDGGLGNAFGTAGSDPWVIAAGASTSERVYAQMTSYGFQLGNGHWTDNQVSAVSGAGISQTNKVMDVLAPGDLNWALCSNKLDAQGSQQYFACVGNQDTSNPSNIEFFGGSSEATPLTAGTAALVIQAYRQTHHGASPSPAQVRTVIDDSADDLGLPTSEQGNGLLDGYRAVQLARGINGGTPTGSGLATSDTQLSATAGPNATVTNTLTVSNPGSAAQPVGAAVRQITKVIGQQSQTVNLNATSPAHTFIDAFGINRSYVETTFTVPAGTDRLVASIAWPGAAGPGARLSLLDPSGAFAAYTLPQGAGNLGQVDIHQAQAGTWTAIVWTSADAFGFTGSVSLRTTDYQATSAGSVTPSSFTLAPGASRTVTVRTTAPASDATADSIVLTGSAGQITTVPVVTRTVQQVAFASPARFSGTFQNGNGRSLWPAQANTYLFKVPSGAADLDVNLTVTGTPPNTVMAHLSDPSGEPVANDLNQHPSGNATVTDAGLQIVHAAPVAGVYRLTLELTNPISGAPLPEQFTGSVTLNGAHVVANGVPNSSQVQIGSGGSTQSVTIYNTSPQPQNYFIDPRSASSATYSLVAVGGKSSTDPEVAHSALPLPSDDVSVVPSWLVPTQATQLTVAALASNPIDFDVMALDTPSAINSPNDPDVEAPTGTSSSVTHTAHEIGSSLWGAFPTLHGATSPGGAAPGAVDFRASITAKAFFADYTSSTGDPLVSTVDAGASPATPITIPAGGNATVTLHLTPSGAAGSVEQGSLYVDTLNSTGSAGTSGLVDEVAAIPFAFTVA